MDSERLEQIREQLERYEAARDDPDLWPDMLNFQRDARRNVAWLLEENAKLQRAVDVLTPLVVEVRGHALPLLREYEEGGDPAAGYVAQRLLVYADDATLADPRTPKPLRKLIADEQHTNPEPSP